MAVQKSAVIQFTASGSFVVLGAGNSFILNAISASSFTSNSGATGSVLILQDSAGSLLFQRDMISALSCGDFIHLSGLSIPSTLNGGLTIVSSLSGGVGTQWLSVTVIYKVP